MKALEVAPNEINTELAKLWKAKEGKKRFALFNMLFYTRSCERRSYLHQIGEKAVEKSPSRLLFIEVGDNNQTALKAKISLLELPHSTICCEKIELIVPEKQLKDLLLILLPYLLPDLPTYLILAGSALRKDPILYPLEKLSDRLICDSVISDNLVDFSQELLSHGVETGCSIADLNWARCQEWRSLLASVFKSKKRLKELQTTKKIFITYNANSSSSFGYSQGEALYLLVWLAVKLNWKYRNKKEEKELLSLEFESVNGSILMEIAPKKAERLAPNIIVDMQIIAENGRLFKFDRDPKHPGNLEITICSQEQCEKPVLFRFSTIESGRALSQEIGNRGSSPDLLEVLRQIAAMKGVKKQIDKRRFLVIPGDKESTFHYCAAQFISLAKEACADHGAFYVALSGGSTPKAIYELLASDLYNTQVEWRRVHLFFGDERSVPKEHPDSNYKMALDTGFAKNVPQEQIYRMVAEEEIEKNALQYEKKIKEVLGNKPFDLVMLGVGEDGHTASLFPDTAALTIENQLVAANQTSKGSRMTLTYPCINSARHKIFYALGKSKQAILSEVLKEKAPYPATKIGTAADPALWIADTDAAFHFN